MILARCRTALLAACVALAAMAATAAAASAARAPDWPAVARQLQQARVIPGSALEKLVLANQDAALLRPGEAADGSGLPLWLRVWWRKRHPASHPAAGDSTGGYPLILRDFYEWMLDHQDLRRGDPPASRPSSADAAGSGEQRISGAQDASRGETAVRVNRYDPRQIVAASKNLPPNAAPGLSGAQMAIFYSSDGGVSWGQSYLPWAAGDIFMGDPAVDWTSDGTAWATIIGVTMERGLLVRAYRSSDGGATWTLDATVSTADADKEMMWVDHSPASPFKDNVYVIWNGDYGTVYVARRNGPNGSWQAPRQIATAGSGTDVKTNQAGDVFAFMPGHYLAKSTDGGASFSPEVKIAQPFGSFQVGVPANDGRKVLIYTVGGAYRAAGRDDVYVAWDDLSGEPGCMSDADAPGANAAATCKTRIFFARSTDGGATWSAPVKINDPPGLDDQFLPWLVVDEATGGIAVSYYDTAGDASRTSVNVYYQSSADHGQSFGPPFAVTTAATNETTAGASWFQFGDYAGMDGVAGVFFPAWTDRRDGTREEIWTAAILDDSAPCIPPAAPGGATATPNGPTGIDLAWSAVPDATRYSILRASVSGGPYAPVGTAAGTAFADAGVSCNTTYHYRISAANLYCSSGGSSEASASTAACAANLGFYTLPPCRVFDTRGGTPLASGTARRFQVAGLCGIPADARAVAANWTIVEPQGQGLLTIYPGDAQLPLATTLGFAPNHPVRANNAMVLLAGDGSGGINAFATIGGGGKTDLVLDVGGYFK